MTRSLDPALPRRRRLLAVAIVALIGGLLVQAPGGHPAGAADPGQGTVGPADLSVTWQGQFYGASAIPVPALCPPPDPANAICDHFFLTVDVDEAYWETHDGGVDITIGWADASDDFDMYVFQDGSQVDSSGGTTNSEKIFLEEPFGLYEVRVVPFLVTNSAYEGTATFESVEGGEEPNPPRETGGLAFGPSTNVDPQRTEGEPLNLIAPDGSYWETGPWGTTTQNAFVHRSVDGGDQFNVVSPIQLRPDNPPGGGDTDIVVDDQGNAYFTDLEALVNNAVAVSNDDGNTWRKNPFSELQVGVDRQWFAIDHGPTGGVEDNTVFLSFREVARGLHIYSTPGSTGPADPVGGLVYVDSSAGAPGPIASDTTCGQLVFDHVKRNLYYPCGVGDHVRITVGHVEPGQRTGIEYVNRDAPASPGGGPVGDVFVQATTDRAGNLYAVWADETDHNIYYSASKDAGETWGPVVRINGGDAETNVFPWPEGGVRGTLGVIWYGTPANEDSDAMPSWFNDRQAAAQFPWFGYAALIRGAASDSPTIVQQRFTRKPMHYGQICSGGLGCTTSGGDRTMLEYGALAMGARGAVRIIYNDTTSQHHGPHLFETRQLAGPTLLGTTISERVPRNPSTDPTGDAQAPHYSPTGPGPNQPRFDLTRLKIVQPRFGVLQFRIQVDDLSSFAPPPGRANSLWLATFNALSVGDEGEEAYRIFYVGAESEGGAPPTFFAGSGESAHDAVPGNGCVIRLPEECKLVQYPPEVEATGEVVGNELVIEVPIENGFGPDRPLKGRILYNMTAFTFGRNDSATDIYLDIDATRAFDYVIQGGVKVSGHAHDDFNGTATRRDDVHVSLSVTDLDEGAPTQSRLQYWDLRGDPPGAATHGFRCTGRPQGLRLLGARAVQVRGTIACETFEEAASFVLTITDHGVNPPALDAYRMRMFDAGGTVLYDMFGLTKRGDGDLVIELV